VKLVAPNMTKEITFAKNTIPLTHKVAMALTRLASGTTFAVTGALFGYSKATAVLCVLEFLDVLVSNAGTYIKCPTGIFNHNKLYTKYKIITNGYCFR
jgi:hypothetical protein